MSDVCKSKQQIIEFCEAVEMIWPAMNALHIAHMPTLGNIMGKLALCCAFATSMARWFSTCVFTVKKQQQ